MHYMLFKCPAEDQIFPEHLEIPEKQGSYHSHNLFHCFFHFSKTEKVRLIITVTFLASKPVRGFTPKSQSHN